jgi:hypothetical protein
MPPRFDGGPGHLMPHLRHGLVCLIAAVMLGTSSSSVPLLLMSCWHHSRAVVCSCACHHHRRHRLMHFIASHCAPRRRHPVCHIAVAMRPSSPSPCSLIAVALLPRHSHPGPLVAVTLVPSSPAPCSPHPITPRCLWPIRLPSNTRAGTCSILDPVEPQSAVHNGDIGTPPHSNLLPMFSSVDSNPHSESTRDLGSATTSTATSTSTYGGGLPGSFGEHPI